MNDFHRMISNGIKDSKTFYMYFIEVILSFFITLVNFKTFGISTSFYNTIINIV